jgi:hypothetical protein
MIRNKRIIFTVISISQSKFNIMFGWFCQCRFICIKDFSAQKITSFKLNLFYFFIYCCQLVSNHVNSDHVPSFSCHDVWNVRQTTSGVYAITVTTSVFLLHRFFQYIDFPYLLTLSIPDEHNFRKELCILH